MLIGITGKYCAGKNLVALLLEKRSIPVLDVDKLGHQVIENEKEKLLARFGTDILNAEGFVDRKKLGSRVFGRPEELSALEEMIHPGVNRETTAWIEKRKEGACAVNAALLHRSSAFKALDAVIVVQAPFFLRLLRAKKRDKLPWADLIKRLQSQREFNSHFSEEKTDIYRVKNTSCFGFARNRLKKRIDVILSCIFSNEGITGK